MQTHSSPRRAVAAPVAAGCALAAGALYVAVVDPAGGHSLVPPCPLHATTGLWCPGCGLTRAAHALAHGHIAAAFGYNLLFPLFFGAIGAALWTWFRVARGLPARWRSMPSLPSWTPVAFGVVLFVFTVLRNIPSFSALAP